MNVRERAGYLCWVHETYRPERIPDEELDAIVKTLRISLASETSIIDLREHEAAAFRIELQQLADIAGKVISEASLRFGDARNPDGSTNELFSLVNLLAELSARTGTSKTLLRKAQKGERIDASWCPKCEGYGDTMKGKPCPDCDGTGRAAHLRSELKKGQS